MQPPRENCTE